MHAGEEDQKLCCYAAHEVLEVDSAHEVLEVDAAHEVLEVDSAHEVLAVDLHVGTTWTPLIHSNQIHNSRQ